MIKANGPAVGISEDGIKIAGERIAADVNRKTKGRIALNEVQRYNSATALFSLLGVVHHDRLDGASMGKCQDAIVDAIIKIA